MSKTKNKRITKLSFTDGQGRKLKEGDILDVLGIGDMTVKLTNQGWTADNGSGVVITSEEASKRGYFVSDDSTKDQKENSDDSTKDKKVGVSKAFKLLGVGDFRAPTAKVTDARQINNWAGDNRDKTKINSKCCIIS